MTCQTKPSEGCAVRERTVRRERARRLLVGHYRFRWTVSADALERCRRRGPWWLASVEPVLPLLFGLRSSRADRLRRRLQHARDRLT
jgi:hypothetical protein